MYANRRTKSWPRDGANSANKSDNVSRRRKKPLLFSWRTLRGRVATMVPVGRRCMVYFRSRGGSTGQTKGEPDGTTSALASATTLQVVLPFHPFLSILSIWALSPTFLPYSLSLRLCTACVQTDWSKKINLEIREEIAVDINKPSWKVHPY